jgi:hypothetical protein
MLGLAAVLMRNYETTARNSFVCIQYVAVSMSTYGDKVFLIHNQAL